MNAPDEPMAKLDRIEYKLDRILQLLQKLMPDELPAAGGPPYTGPEVYRRTITQEDISRAFQEGRRSLNTGMP